MWFDYWWRLAMRERLKRVDSGIKDIRERDSAYWKTSRLLDEFETGLLPTPHWQQGEDPIDPDGYVLRYDKSARYKHVELENAANRLVAAVLGYNNDYGTRPSQTDGKSAYKYYVEVCWPTEGGHDTDLLLADWLLSITLQQASDIERGVHPSVLSALADLLEGEHLWSTLDAALTGTGKRWAYIGFLRTVSSGCCLIGGPLGDGRNTSASFATAITDCSMSQLSRMMSDKTLIQGVTRKGGMLARTPEALWTDADEEEFRQRSDAGNWTAYGVIQNRPGLHTLMKLFCDMSSMTPPELNDRLRKYNEPRKTRRMAALAKDTSEGHYYYKNGELFGRSYLASLAIMVGALLAFAVTALTLAKYGGKTAVANMYSLAYLPAGAIIGVGPLLLRRNWQYYDMVRLRWRIDKKSQAKHMPYAAIRAAQKVGLRVWGRYKCAYDDAVVTSLAEGMEADTATDLMELITTEEIRLACFRSRGYHEDGVSYKVKFRNMEVVLPSFVSDYDYGGRDLLHAEVAQQHDTEVELPNVLVHMGFIKQYAPLEVGGLSGVDRYEAGTQAVDEDRVCQPGMDVTHSSIL